MPFTTKIRLHAHWLSYPVVALFFILFTGTAYAQFTPPKPAPEAEKPVWPTDSLGRRTPRGTVLGFIKAVSQEDYVQASQYLNLRNLSRTNPGQSGPQLARSLQKLLDEKGNITPRTLISNDTTGLVNDKEGPGLDLVGTADIGGETYNLLVEKTTGPAGGPIWLFSKETVARIPALTVQASGFTVDNILPRFLIKNKWNGIPIGHWLAMFVLVVVAYLLAGVIMMVVVGLVPIVWRKARDPHVAEVIQAFVLPLRVYLAVWLFVFASQNVGISIIIRQKFSDITLVVGLIAFLLLLWQLIDVVSKYAQRWLVESGQPGRLSAVLFLRRGIKLVLMAFGTVSVLNLLGWDVTTGIAALGIGGIALALGAQKTIENFVGSITIIADQPLRVGDFCKIDDVTGTVEQIGIRSTRIRTANRTIVVIPNGQLAALKIENFAFRDRLLFNPKLQLRYETTPDQIRYLLVELRNLLQNTPIVNPNPARVRFAGMADSSLDIEIFAYIDTADFNEFLAVKEDLTLKMMDIIAESGTGVAFPSQTLYMSKDTPLSEEKARQAEEKIRAWQQKETPDKPQSNGQDTPDRHPNS